ncbi:hypothetical protein EON82_05335 [bacterium]|nr:MAG: hypothetical protein EON82_05335 [bacterium]
MILSLILGAQAPELPPVPREFRAAWVATVDNIDWPSKRGLPAATQRAEMIRILDRAAALKLNAIVFQVRPAADAMYRSSLEPWSEYLTGRQGRDPGYDPLEFTVEQAHKRGLELHVWFNPYRAKHPSAKGQLAPNHLAKTGPGIVKTYGKHLWMDPGEPTVQKRSRDVFLDVVRRYDIDGVHIDDYFYPYPEDGAPFPDESSYRRYGNGLSRDDWRRKNVDDFVRDIYASIHQVKPWVQFGVSPFGIYRPGIPAGIAAGIDQYATLYADPLKWLREGWLDYLTPQLYWPIAQRPQSFPVLLDWWRSQNVMGRHIWPGLFTSKLNPGEKIGGFSTEEFVRQINLTRATGDSGHVHFSMKALMQDSRGVASRLRGALYTQDALPPASTWLASTPPPAPVGASITDGRLTWSPASSNARPFRYVLWTQRGDRWNVRVLPGHIDAVDENPRSALGTLQSAAIATVDRAGNISQATYFPTP